MLSIRLVIASRQALHVQNLHVSVKGQLPVVYIGFVVLEREDEFTVAHFFTVKEETGRPVPASQSKYIVTYQDFGPYHCSPLFTVIQSCDSSVVWCHLQNLKQTLYARLIHHSAV
jgi:hypothetical protein